MQQKPKISKKTIAILGMLALGVTARAGIAQQSQYEHRVKNWQEPNCHVYDQKDGSCITCSWRFWKTKDWRCVQVDDQCKTWSQTDGACTSCYPGYGLSSGKCVIGGKDDSNKKEPKVPDLVDDNCEKYQYHHKGLNKWSPSWFEGCDKICIKCKPDHYMDQKGKCKKIPKNCLKVDKKGLCSQCKSGYVPEISGGCMFLGKPIKYCDQYKFVDANKKTSQKWFPGAKVICGQCQKNYYPNSDKTKCQKRKPEPKQKKQINLKPKPVQQVHQEYNWSQNCLNYNDQVNDKDWECEFQPSCLETDEKDTNKQGHTGRHGHTTEVQQVDGEDCEDLQNTHDHSDLKIELCEDIESCQEQEAACKQGEKCHEGGAASHQGEKCHEGGAACKQGEKCHEGGAACKQGEKCHEGGAASHQGEKCHEGGKGDKSHEGGAACKQGEKCHQERVACKQGEKCHGGQECCQGVNCDDNCCQDENCDCQVNAGQDVEQEWCLDEDYEEYYQQTEEVVDLGESGPQVCETNEYNQVESHLTTQKIYKTDQMFEQFECQTEDCSGKSDEVVEEYAPSKQKKKYRINLLGKL